MYFIAYKKGFTLIELMVVIAIISVLASFVAPSFEKHIAKAKLVDIQLYGSNLTSTIDEHLLTHSEFPDSTTFAAIKPDHTSIELIKSITLNKVDSLQGTVTIQLNNDIGIQENQYIRYARANTGLWSCDANLDHKILPEHCVAIVQAED